MLDRRKHLLSTKSEHEQVKLTSGETPEVTYNSWFAKVIATPRSCERHRGTKLVLVSRESKFWPVYDRYRHWDEQPVPNPGEFHFRAVFSCPSCCVAYALCPSEFHTTSFDTFDTSTQERADALARCREFAALVNKNGCGFALFVGGPGNGKTRLASNIVRALDNADALYTRQGELTVALRASYGRKDVYLHRRQCSDDDEDENEPPTPLEIAQGVRFLILDELGCNPLANDERLFLDELLKHRYDERKPTVLISNLALDQLKEFLGDALTDRVKHASGNGRFILQFSGQSYRRSDGADYLGGLR